MSELVTTGVWRVNPGQETEFVAAWTRFAEWAAGRPGAGTLRLGRDAADPSRFVSFAAWLDSSSVRAWKSSPEFREGIAQVLQYVDGFEPAELDVVETVTVSAHAGLV
jgi:heme-degrading monooxygenase HmoA